MLKYLAAAALLAVPVTARPVAPIEYRAIVLIRCGPKSGTAFSIGAGSYLTAQHVTVGAECTIDGAPVVKLLEDEALDIAEVKGPATSYALATTCRGFSPGTFYDAVGYAQGVYRVTLPLLAAPRLNYEQEANGLNSFIGETIPGMSGGPVLDESGTVVGIVNRRTPARSRALADTPICKGRRP